MHMFFFWGGGYIEGFFSSHNDAWFPSGLVAVTGCMRSGPKAPFFWKC